MVTEWVRAHLLAGTLAELTVAHPDQLVSDSAVVAVVAAVDAVAAAKVARLPLVTGQPDLAGLDPDVAVILLPRRL
ncbi:MAG: hypothetical protein AB7Q42_05300 [Acidimicrobiia bacterium]